jgi:hypothetical protein
MTLRQIQRYTDNAAALRAEENLNEVTVDAVQYLDVEDRRELLDSWHEVAGIEIGGDELVRVSLDEFREEIRRPVA